MGPATLGLLGKAGLGRIRVHRRPRVCILGTGDELVDPADAVGRPEAVVDSNGAMLEAGCLEENAEVLCVERAPDSVEAVAAWLRGALERADVILTTGGASVGDHDVIAEAWEAAGIRTELWKVAMKPGKPVRFGRPSSGSALCFALPGNPLSALSGFDLFVRATLTELQGARWLPRPRLRLPANEPLRNKGSRRTYLRADLVATPEGPRIAIPPLQGSHMLRSAAALPLVAVLPEGPLEIPVGAPLDAFVVGEGLRGWVLEPLEGPGGDG